MNLKLRSADKATRGERWILCLDPDEVRLVDEDGNAVVSFPRSEAQAKLLLPSFWESVAGIVVKKSESQRLVFEQTPALVSKIRDYLNRTHLMGGASKVSAVLRNAILQLAACPILVAIGIAVSLVVHAMYAGVPGGAPRPARLPGAGLLILGLIAGYFGIKTLLTYRRLVRLSREEE